MLSDGQFQFSLAAMVFGIVLMGAMYWLEKNPRNDLRPRLLPTTLLMLFGLLLAIGAAVHLLTMLGFTIPQR